jgi:hypothetical protein
MDLVEKYIGMNETYDVGKKLKRRDWVDVSDLAQHYILKHGVDASHLKKDKKTMEMLNKTAELSMKSMKQLGHEKKNTYKEIAKLLVKLDIYDWTETA